MSEHPASTLSAGMATPPARSIRAPILASRLRSVATSRRRAHVSMETSVSLLMASMSWEETLCDTPSIRRSLARSIGWLVTAPMGPAAILSTRWPYQASAGSSCWQSVYSVSVGSGQEDRLPTVEWRLWQAACPQHCPICPRLQAQGVEGQRLCLGQLRGLRFRGCRSQWPANQAGPTLFRRHRQRFGLRWFSPVEGHRGIKFPLPVLFRTLGCCDIPP